MQHVQSDVANNQTGLQTREFQFKASSHAFKVLSSTLYENKPRAVLRELAANGWDAHKAAGIEAEVPVDIHLPHEYAPELIVTDYGTGMTCADAHSLYMTFFSTDKDQTNDQIGGFGLGSKSPYSISEAFNIETCKDGEFTVISCFIDAGIPTSVIVSHEFGVDKPNGTKVTVPIADENLFHKLYQEAQDLFKYWELPPKVYKDTEVIQIHTVATTLSQSGFLVCPPKMTYNKSNLTLSEIFPEIVVGNYAYPIPASIASSSTIDLEAVKSFYFTARNEFTPLVLKADIGEIEVAASRERIEVTPENIAYIEDKINSVLDVTMDRITDQVTRFCEFIENEIDTSDMFLGLPLDNTSAYNKILKKYDCDFNFISAALTFMKHKFFARTVNKIKFSGLTEKVVHKIVESGILGKLKNSFTFLHDSYTSYKVGELEILSDGCVSYVNEISDQVYIPDLSMFEHTEKVFAWLRTGYGIPQYGASSLTIKELDHHYTSKGKNYRRQDASISLPDIEKAREFEENPSNPHTPYVFVLGELDYKTKRKVSDMFLHDREDEVELKTHKGNKFNLHVNRYFEIYSAELYKKASAMKFLKFLAKRYPSSIFIRNASYMSEAFTDYEGTYVEKTKKHTGKLKDRIIAKVRTKSPHFDDLSLNEFSEISVAQLYEDIIPKLQQSNGLLFMTSAKEYSLSSDRRNFGNAINSLSNPYLEGTVPYIHITLDKNSEVKTARFQKADLSNVTLVANDFFLEISVSHSCIQTSELDISKLTLSALLNHDNVDEILRVVAIQALSNRLRKAYFSVNKVFSKFSKTRQYTGSVETQMRNKAKKISNPKFRDLRLAVENFPKELIVPKVQLLSTLIGKRTVDQIFTEFDESLRVKSQPLGFNFGSIWEDAFIGVLNTEFDLIKKALTSAVFPDIDDISWSDMFGIQRKTFDFAVVKLNKAIANNDPSLIPENILNRIVSNLRGKIHECVQVR